MTVSGVMYIYQCKISHVQVGITGISESEASKLLNETLSAPNDPTKYVVQLDLHCLDVLRKAIYPDEYPDGWTYHNNGTVNHNSVMGLHWGK